MYLHTKNLKTKRKSKKLDQVKVGPFSILEARGPQNYRLQLPEDAHIHPVFHISLLEPADPDIPLQTIFHFQPEEQQEWEVEKILESGGPNRYLIKWKGYPKSESTWEPLENLVNCRKKLFEFFSSLDTQQDYFRGGHKIPDISTQRKFLDWIRTISSQS